jgi:hypothetical protein
MNILTIPVLSGGASHIIPLYVLHQRYFKKDPDISNYFLLGNGYHSNFINQDINVVGIDYSMYKTDSSIEKGKLANKIQKMEEEAFMLVNPNIIIEDCSFMAPLISEKNNIPRISIHRTGFFRSLPNFLRIKGHIHSMEKGEDGNKVVSIMPFIKERKINLNKNKTDINFLKNYLNAKTKLIPGIPSIEILPKDIQNKESYFYTGPLLIEDNPTIKLQEELNEFNKINEYRKKVFITTGLIDNTSIQRFIEYLLENEYAIITTSKVKINNSHKSKLFYNSFLPLNYICSKVDLIIHQCGSGIYHYPILNEKPAITIGTQCFDREDIAIRLEQLKISKHVPHLKDNENNFEIFKNCIKDYERGDLCDFEILKKLKAEVYETMLNFDMEKVIEYTLSKK